MDDDFALTEDQMAELERRDADLVNGIVEPLTVEQLMQRVTSELR